MEYTEALEKFMELLRKVTNEHFDRAGYKNLGYPTYQVEPGGRKYSKISRTSCGSTSVHSFIDKKTGNIYKPAGWSSPAKHARGNIYDNIVLTPEGNVPYMR